MSRYLDFCGNNGQFDDIRSCRGINRGIDRGLGRGCIDGNAQSHSIGIDSDLLDNGNCMYNLGDLGVNGWGIGPRSLGQLLSVDMSVKARVAVTTLIVVVVFVFVFAMNGLWEGLKE